MFSVCSQGGGGTYPKVPNPIQVKMGEYLPPPQVRIGGQGGGSTPWYLLPDQGTYPPTLPRYLSPIQIRIWRGFPQGTYPLPRYLTPRYLSPHTLPMYTYPDVQIRMGGGGTPTYLPHQSTYHPHPHPGPDGEEVAQGTYPCPTKVPTHPARSGWGRGGTPRYLTPPPPTKVPTPRDRTAYGVLDTPRSVCLLRSHRRTVL